MKKPTHWNYRIVAYTVKGVFVKPHRLFAITEVYYNKDGKPSGYVSPDDIRHLTNIEDATELKGDYKLMKRAFKQPILDLDNFPNEFTEG